MQLLTVGNPKTEKGAAFGYHTAVLHLAPNTIAGIRDESGKLVNLCPRATSGCTGDCLYTAGRAGIIVAGETDNAILRARIARTRFLFSDPVGFRAKLSHELELHARAATRLALTPAFRPNGTSDVNWLDDFGGSFAGMFFRLPYEKGFRLYDYTKRVALFDAYRAAKFPIDLTFSRAETYANKRDALTMLARGERVAIVYGVGRNDPLPASHRFGDVEYPITDGDASDLRFLDGPGIIGLRAKGRARKSTSGFVVRGFTIRAGELRAGE